MRDNYCFILIEKANYREDDRKLFSVNNDEALSSYDNGPIIGGIKDVGENSRYCNYCYCN